MSRITRTLIAAALVGAAAVPAAAPAVAMNELGSGGKAFKIHNVQLGIKPPAACPGVASVQGWVYMTHPTTVEIMIAKKGQGVVAGPISITSVKASNGQFVATYSNQFNVNASVAGEYRMLVGGGSGKGSNWVPLNVAC